MIVVMIIHIGVINGVTSLCQGRLDALYTEVKKVLVAAEIPPESIPGLAALFDSNSSFGRPFLNMETAWQQLTFYKSHFRFIVSAYLVN